MSRRATWKIGNTCLWLTAALWCPREADMKKINVALIGYGFMGRAHSNAYLKVNRFFDIGLEPVLKVVSARSEVNLRKLVFGKFSCLIHSEHYFITKPVTS